MSHQKLHFFNINSGETVKHTRTPTCAYTYTLTLIHILRTHTHTHMHLNIHMFTLTHTRSYTHVHTDTLTQTHTHTLMYQIYSGYHKHSVVSGLFHKIFKTVYYSAYPPLVANFPCAVARSFGAFAKLELLPSYVSLANATNFDQYASTKFECERFSGLQWIRYCVVGLFGSLPRCVYCI